jgi:hypothetical protein
LDSKTAKKNSPEQKKNKGKVYSIHIIGRKDYYRQNNNWVKPF